MLTRKTLSSTLVLTLLLTLCLSTPAAGASPAPDAAATLFSEQTITIPDGYTPTETLTRDADGNPVTAAMTADGQWVLLTWKDPASRPEVTPLSFGGNDGPEAYGGGAISHAPDGRWLASLSSLGNTRTVSGAPSPGSEGSSSPSGGSTSATPGASTSSAPGYMTFSLGGAGQTIYWFNPDGSFDIKVTVDVALLSAVALSGRRFAGMDYNGAVSVYDETGAALASPSVPEAYALAAGESLYILTPTAIAVLDSSDGKKIGEIAFDAGYGARITLGHDGLLYVLTDDHLTRIDPATGAATRVMERTGTILGDPSVSISAMEVLAGGSVAVALGGSSVTISGGGAITNVIRSLTSDEPPALYLLTPIGSASTSERSELRVTSLYASDRLRKAANEFERANPDIKVILETRLAEGDSSPTDDHIRALNTDLLAGKGGDVLMLDGLPMDQYISRGVLKDISALVSSLGLLPGVARGSQSSDGVTYAVPAQFTFDTLWGNKDVVSRVGSLADLPRAALEPDQAPMMARTPAEWLELLYPACEASIRGEDGAVNFESEAFVRFLETVKELYDSQGEINDLELPGRLSNSAAVSARVGIDPQEMLAVYNGSIALNAMRMAGLAQVSMAYSLSGGAEGGRVPIPGLDGAGAAYTPLIIAGVNALSRQPDLAEEFIRVLFSDETQSMESLGGIPTTSSALDKLFEDAIDRSENADIRQILMIPGAGQLTIQQPDRAAWESIRAMCDTLDQPSITDATLLGFITEETAGYFNGIGTAREAARLVQQRAFFYLNE
ncbi:MAG: extracellular solute-binding protein [Oscillospiraceae bacterium]|jgi:ABC-type glycerol-3-phosphate transport system substrate-binding protein|nr:extracellular solute-binding protein [Oscillospiraceae bacterium]